MELLQREYNGGATTSELQQWNYNHLRFLLLLIAGDVENNPGPSQIYNIHMPDLLQKNNIKQKR